jgi:predicted lipoprotein with Yx(FWY)xxD motif
MNWSKSLIGLSMLFLLILAACGPAAVATEVVTEAPADADADEPAPVVTEEDAQDEDMDEPTEEPMAEADPTVIVASSGLGDVLVDPEGMTLYMFVNDGPDESACYDSCAANWPPLLVEGEPVAGEGLDSSLLGTTERLDGTLQVTYNGMPLYYYVQDSAAGDTTGQGVGGAWYVVNPAGEAVTAAAGEDLPDY